MSNEKKTILVFNAELQKETPHVIDFAGNGEIILTCEQTGRFLKFPKGTTGEVLKELLAKHKAANEGQVTAASLEAEKEKLLGDLLGEKKPE